MWKGDWLPKTSLQRYDSEVNGKDNNEDNLIETSFRGGGINLTPLEPMRKWRLQFDGNLCNTVSYTIMKNNYTINNKIDKLNLMFSQ